MTKKRTTPPPPQNREEDVAGPLPRELLAEWRASSRSEARAWELLKPALVEGTVLSGDGSRITALSQELDPVELAARVDRTKRVVHALATAAGGRAPGASWSADNFQLIFPAHAPVEFVIGVALESHRRLAPDERAIRICLAIHRGRFFELGGGLYGEDASLVEWIAEDSAQAGETLITRSAFDALRPSTRLATARRTDLDHLAMEVRRISPTASLPVPLAMASNAGTYPLPFSPHFHESLREIDNPETWPARRASLLETYTVERTVVMAELCAPIGILPYDILEAGLRDARIVMSVARLLPEGGEVIENFGSYMLATFLDPRMAIEFACRLGRHLFDNNLQVQIGLDRGPVLLVPAEEPDGYWNVLGRPVYIASKLCHELGVPNRIMMSGRAVQGVTLPGPCPAFSHVVSAVTCEGSYIEI